MYEKIVLGLEKLSILQCQAAAKDIGFDSATFKLCGPNGEKSAKWLDAYMGLFQVDGLDGFCTVGQFQYLEDLWCKDLMPSQPRSAK